MEIRVTQVQRRVRITVLHIAGSIHLGNAEQLETTARAAIENGTRAVVIDLTQVPTMTSAGLRVLHVLYRLLRDTSPGGIAETVAGEGASAEGKSPHLKLVNPPPALRRVLTIAGFDTFLEIHDTVEAALESF